ncbi:MAG TPA: class I SAM-dependent methyltransferase [Clostridia bacterium]|nr:class I SAM-dependent methyltransferase [Clostridia bacterium]
MSYSLKAYDRFMYFFEKKALDEMRQNILKSVKGNVLEIGPGTGVNLKYYDRNTVSQLTYIDVDYTKGLEVKAKEKCPNISFVDGTVEEMPFDDNSFDHIVFTLVFCSVKNPLNGLSEIKRVLKSNGEIHFIEHVLPEKKPLKPIFNYVNSFWHQLSGGCNLNRKTVDTIRDAGFRVDISGKGFSNIFVGGVGRLK